MIRVLYRSEFKFKSPVLELIFAPLKSFLTIVGLRASRRSVSLVVLDKNLRD